MADAHSGSSGASSGSPGLGDLLGLFGSANPFSGIARTVGQFQQGVAELLAAVENFNATMEQFNLVAARVNSLLDAVEEPIRVAVPQITRTLRAADTLVEQLDGLTTLPRDIGEVMEVLSDLTRRLQPLGQMAESAGALFGLPSLTSIMGGGRSAGSPKAPIDVAPPPPKIAKRTTATRTRAAPAKRSRPR